MAINASVHCNGELLPAIILLTNGCYHHRDDRGTFKCHEEVFVFAAYMKTKKVSCVQIFLQSDFSLNNFKYVVGITNMY